MKKSWLLSVALLLALAMPAFAIDSFIIKESDGQVGGAPPPCPLNANLTGNCANYRWYNVCSGYIWIFSAWSAGDGVGTRFGAPENPCVVTGNCVERTITYYRNVVPSYNQTVDVFLEADAGQDGCKDGTLASCLNLDPGLRWNCCNVNYTLGAGFGAGAAGVIVKTVHDGGTAPTFATDGPYTQTCDPVGNDHTYYYGVNNSQCIPWRSISPTGRGDNLLTWLVVDQNCVNATENTSWGKVKGLYQ